MESPRKRRSSDTESSKKSIKGRFLIPSENVLLNYTYYLDEYQKRKITLGFDTETLEAKIIFSYIGRFPVSATYSGWTSAYSYLNNLKSEISGHLSENKHKPKKEYRIPVEIGSIRLKELELLKLFDMLEFLNIVMYHNHSASESVKEYFNQYVSKCKTKNVDKLSNDDFFIPSRSSYVHINYSRLFYEIPLFCSSNLALNLLIMNM